MILTDVDSKEIKDIETKLKNYKYNEIPQEFLNLVENNFEIFSYLKSLLEMKKDGIDQVNSH
tara:strand:+ start:1659 stop:1844 length:186 start_codon:yes stop_codon:yes gene_type:complete